MKIETKFDVDENVITIHNDSIVTLPVKSFEYNSIYKSTKYTLLKYKAVNFGDKDGVVVKSEDECFKSLKELTEFYGSKQNR